MRIIARNTLRAFSDSLKGTTAQGAVESALQAWYHEVSHATWRNPADVKRSYRNASIVGNDRVVFNIKGNAYRLVVAVDYRRQVVFIKWLGSHREYDAINALTVQYAGKAD